MTSQDIEYLKQRLFNWKTVVDACTASNTLPNLRIAAEAKVELLEDIIRCEGSRRENTHVG